MWRQTLHARAEQGQLTLVDGPAIHGAEAATARGAWDAEIAPTVIAQTTLCQ